jgi:hypothetical protein
VIFPEATMSAARPVATALLALSLGVPAVLTAQDTGLVAGARVRVVRTSDSQTVTTGRLVRLAGDTITLRPDRSILDETVLLTAAHRLDVSIATHRRAGQGMVTGFLVGAGIGAVVGALSYQKPDCSDQFICLDFGPGYAAGVGAAFMGFLGLVIGGVSGANSWSDEWRPAGARAVAFGITPSAHGGAALGVSIPL